MDDHQNYDDVDDHHVYDDDDMDDHQVYDDDHHDYHNDDGDDNYQVIHHGGSRFTILFPLGAYQ